MTNLIDDYLARLDAELRLRPRLRARILAEVEDHLYEAAQRQEEPGCSPEEMQRKAIERFGSPQLVAQRFHQELAAARGRLIVRIIVLAVGGLAAIAITFFISQPGTVSILLKSAGQNLIDLFSLSARLAIVAALAFGMSAVVLFCGSFGRQRSIARRLLALVMLSFTLWSALLAQRAWSIYLRFTDPGFREMKLPPEVFSGIRLLWASQVLDQFQLLCWLLLGLISLVLFVNIGKTIFAPYFSTKGIARCLTAHNTSSFSAVSLEQLARS